MQRKNNVHSHAAEETRYLDIGAEERTNDHSGTLGHDFEEIRIGCECQINKHSCFADFL